MNQPVPPQLSPVIRHAVAASPTRYQARTNAEHVFGDMRAVPWAQYRALERYRTSAEWPAVSDAVRDLVDERASTLTHASPTARYEFAAFPDDVQLRATKLTYDGWAELDAMSQVVDETGAPVILNELNDVQRKIDAVLYVPRWWAASWAQVRLAFSRRPPERLDVRERRRAWASQAAWEFRTRIEDCDWIGAAAHVAFFARTVIVAELAALRDAITMQPTLFGEASS